jgi:hypothetical protein
MIYQTNRGWTEFVICVTAQPQLSVRSRAQRGPFAPADGNGPAGGAGPVGEGSAIGVL